MGKKGSPGGKSKGGNSTQRGLHPPLPVQTQLGQVTNCHKQLCKSPQEPPLDGGFASTGEQKYSRTGSNSKITGFLQQAILVSKPNNQWRPILDLSTLNTFLNTESFKMETPETIRTSPEVKVMVLQRSIRIHQYLDDWLVSTRSHHTCLQHTQTLVALCRELGWLANREKSELDPKQVFNFVGYQFNMKEGKVRPTRECWQVLTTKIQAILSSPVCPVFPHFFMNFSNNFFMH